MAWAVAFTVSCSLRHRPHADAAVWGGGGGLSRGAGERRSFVHYVNADDAVPAEAAGVATA